MAKIKVTTDVVNRGGKKYIAKDWIIEVKDEDLIDFEWFKKVEAPKKPKNDNNKKRS